MKGKVKEFFVCMLVIIGFMKLIVGYCFGVIVFLVFFLVGLVMLFLR